MGFRRDSGREQARSGRRRPPRTPKGRQVDPRALEEVRALLGDARAPARSPHRASPSHSGPATVISSAAHLAALAQEMKLALAEVYEVATFYAHFDVVKEGETPPPAITVRVCNSLSCAMAGAEHLLRRAARPAGPRRTRGPRALHGRLRPRAGLRRRSCAGHAGDAEVVGRGARRRTACSPYACKETFRRYVRSGGYARSQGSASRGSVRATI